MRQGMARSRLAWLHSRLAVLYASRTPGGSAEMKAYATSANRCHLIIVVSTQALVYLPSYRWAVLSHARYPDSGRVAGKAIVSESTLKYAENLEDYLPLRANIYEQMTEWFIGRHSLRSCV